jgi:hypothetical protein
MKECRGFVTDTELEFSGSKGTVLEERDRAGHGLVIAVLLVVVGPTGHTTTNSTATTMFHR